MVDFDSLIDRYKRLGKDERAIILGMAFIMFLLVLVAILTYPVQIGLGVSIALVIGFLRWVLVKSNTSLAPEHIMAIGAVAVALILAGGIVMRVIDLTLGGIAIGALVGGGSIAEVIRAQRRG